MSVSVGELTATIKLIDQLTPVLLKISDNLAKTREKTTPVKSETDKLQQSYNKLAASLDPVVARTQKYDKALETLNHALKAGIINQSTYNKHLDQAKAKLQETSNWTSRLSSELGTSLKSQLLGVVGVTALVTAGLGLLVGISNKVVEVNVEKEKSERLLEAAIRRSAQASDIRLESAIKLSDVLSRQLGTDDEAIQAAIATGLQYNRIGSQILPRLTQAALDASAATGDALPNAMEKAAKMVNNPLRALTLLNREGYAVGASQSDLAKNLLRTNDILGAQEEILKILESRYGGTAAEMRDTMGGALTALNTNWENFLEAVSQDHTGPLREGIEKLNSLLIFMTDHVDDLAIGWNSLIITFDQADIALIRLSSTARKAAPLLGLVGIGLTALGGKPKGQEDIEKLQEDIIKREMAIVRLMTGLDKLGKSHSGAGKGALEQTEAERKLGEELNKVKAILQSVTDAIVSYNEQVGENLDNIKRRLDNENLLSAALGKSVVQYNLAKVAGDRANAVDAEADRLRKAHRAEIDRLLDAQRKLIAIGQPEAAAKVTVEIQKETQAYERLAKIVPEVVGRIFDINQETQARLKVISDDINYSHDLAQAYAELSDATTRSSKASREHAINLEIEATQIERNAIAGSPLAASIERTIRLRHDEIDGIREHTTALNLSFEAQQRLSDLKAQFTDWQSVVNATKKYGSELTSILESHDLLSAAVQRRRIEEEALERFHSEANATQKKSLEEIRALVQEEFDLVNQLNKAWADADIKQWVEEPFRSAFESVKSSFMSNMNEMIISGKANWSDFWKSFLRSALEAIEQWLIRFIAAHRAAQAQAARTAAMNAAAGGGGGGYGYLFGKGGGTRGADASTLDAASSTRAMQQGAPASAWETYGTYAAFAFFAWVGFNIYKGFTKKRITFGEASLGGTTAGSRKISDKLIEIIHSITKDVEAVLKQWNLAVDKLGSVTIGQTSKGVIYVKTALDPLGQVFKTMEEAVEYAKLQAIKLAEYSKTVSALIKAAIHGSKATSLEGLSSDIEFARMLETQNLPEVENRIRSLIDTLVNNFHRAMELFKGDFTQLNTAISSILTSFSTNLWSLYNNLMGIKEDPKVAWERQKAAYNAQQAIVKAQILLLIEEIKARIAAAQAHIAYLMILRGGGDFTGFSGGQGTRTGGQQNEGESGRYSNTKGGGLQDTAPDARNPGNDPQIAALLQILDNLIRALAGLPPEITGDKPKGGFGGGRGGQRDQVRDFISDKKFELAASRMGEYQRQVASITRSYDEQLKAAGKDKKLREELLVLKAEELKLLAEEKAKSTTENFREFLGLVTPFDQVRKTSESLIKDINDSPFGNARKAAMISRVLDEVEKQLNKLSREKAASLFSEMLSDMEKFGATDAQMLEARKSMAILEHGLKMEHYRTEIELLKAEGRLPAEVLANLEKAFNFLSGIDPTKFISGGGSNSPSGPNYDDPGWQWTGAGWVYTDPSIKERSDRAKDLLKKYQEAETDEFTSKLSEINRDFAEIIAALGSTPEILNAKNAALKAALEDFLAPVKDFRQSMDFEDTSTLTGEQQFYAIRDQFRKLTSGPITAKDRDELLRLSELYRNIGKDFTAGEGFRFIDQEIKNALDRFSSVITDQAQLGTITNPMSMEAPNLQRSIEAGNIAVLAEMRGQTGLLKSTDQTIASLDFRLSNPLTFKMVS